LRRANRRSQAREQLPHALELATICGATALAARAESELLATGARVTAPDRACIRRLAQTLPLSRRLSAISPT